MPVTVPADSWARMPTICSSENLLLRMGSSGGQYTRQSVTYLGLEFGRKVKPDPLPPATRRKSGTGAASSVRSEPCIQEDPGHSRNAAGQRCREQRGDNARSHHAHRSRKRGTSIGTPGPPLGLVLAEG